MTNLQYIFSVVKEEGLLQGNKCTKSGTTCDLCIRAFVRKNGFTEQLRDIYFCGDRFKKLVTLIIMSEEEKMDLLELGIENLSGE